jgi:CDP-diacylglycerol--glycerol-3-phosphate 3-phosphatidyltransferase
MPSKLLRDLRTVPNLITLSRIGLIVVAGPIYLYWSEPVAMVLAVVAGLTDYVDGAVARATGQVTFLGEVLDHFCDLAFESSILLMTIVRGFFPPVVLMLYLLRELWVTCLRRFVASRGTNLPSNLVGKLKTNLLMWGFLPTFLSLWGHPASLQGVLGTIGRVAVGTGLVLGYISGWQYTRRFWRIYDGAGSGA